MTRTFIPTGELSFGSPPFLFVTWKIPVFYQLLKEIEGPLILDSPEFPFADGRYRLRFSPELGGITDIKLVNLNGAVPERDVSYEIGFMSRAGEEIDTDIREFSVGGVTEREYYFTKQKIIEKRDIHFPDGTLTVFCSVRLREPSSAGSPMSGGAQTRVSPNDPSCQIRMIGELSSWSPPSVHVTWKIPFFSFVIKASQAFSIESPNFNFAGGLYSLRLFSVSDHRYAKFGLMDLAYNNTDSLDDEDSCFPGPYVSYEVALKSITGKEFGIGRKMRPFLLPGAQIFTISRAQLSLRKKTCFPNGILTVFCFVRLRQQKPGGAEISEGMRGVDQLQSDCRQLLLKQTDSDASFRVFGKEFRAHRCILRARSPVFDAMFGQETAEKTSGPMIIDDIDPKSFEEFLEYLYTGRLGTGLSDENALGLYTAAYKFDVAALKAHCVEYIRRNLSLESFCDYMTVALQTKDDKMLWQAVQFFKVYVDRITTTLKWQMFLTAESAAANDLLMQAGRPTEQ